MSIDGLKSMAKWVSLELQPLLLRNVRAGSWLFSTDNILLINGSDLIYAWAQIIDVARSQLSTKEEVICFVVWLPLVPE